MLRALRFMDSMIQRDTMQKAAFLTDLATFWDRFDDRVLRLKVCAELTTCSNGLCTHLWSSASFMAEHIVCESRWLVPDMWTKF